MRVMVASGVFILISAACAGWLASRAYEVRTELAAVRSLAPQFQSQLVAEDNSAAKQTLDQLQSHTGAARAAATDPLWKAAAAVPLIGPNFSAVTEIAVSADDVVHGAAEPILRVSSSVDWESLTPSNGRFDVKPLTTASPSIVSAANTVDLTYTRLTAIDGAGLHPEVAAPLTNLTDTLDQYRQTLNIAADASEIIPSMLGSNGARNYLVLVQNNAEVRATGGLSGALAVMHIEQGTIELTAQSSGSALRKFAPPVEVDPAQTQIYTSRLGTYIGDVNLTPDFPTAAQAAKAMWQERHETRIDGVVALDPVVLAHILEASGPIEAPSINHDAVSANTLPTTLTANNVVQTLLSDVYTSIDNNLVQDAYFASVAEKIFQRLASGEVPGDKLIQALHASSEENRLYVWSGHKEEQQVLRTTPLGGAVSGPSVGGASFGVYFNDGTGAKMDFYVKRTVQVVEQCDPSAYSQFKVRVTMTNTAPSDAASSLPQAVTGGGKNGTPPGNVQTNVVVYGPAQALVEGATVDGVEAPLGSFMHEQRPVGVVTSELEPGESTDVEFIFSKVVQDEKPQVRVTPTVQRTADVLTDVSQEPVPCD